MRRFISTRKFIGLISAALLAASSGTLARAQAPDEKSDLAANAAVQYWQAFAQLPTLDKEQEKILSEWPTVSTKDPAVEKLVHASQASRMYLHRGAKLARCDWGLEYSDGISLMLPHLAKARDLARHAALHARYAFERGNGRALQENATAIMSLARHVGRDPILISILVRYLIEDTAVDLTAPYVPQIKAPYEQVVAAFKALPPAATVQQTLPIEKKHMAGYVIRELTRLEKEKPGSWREHWNHMMGHDAPQAVKEIATFEEAIRLTEKLLPVYDELEKFFALSEKEFDAQYGDFKQKANAANPMAGVLLPALDKVRARERRNQVRLAMLMAAVAVANDGPEKLKDIPDPVIGGPFEYRKLDGGFELKSKLVVDEKPVTLTVGTKAK
jgi:hypothetical protein